MAYMQNDTNAFYASCNNDWPDQLQSALEILRGAFLHRKLCAISNSYTIINASRIVSECSMSSEEFDNGNLCALYAVSLTIILSLQKIQMAV